MPTDKEVFLKQRLEKYEGMLREVNRAIAAETRVPISQRDPERCTFLYCERKQIEAIIAELTAVANA